VFALHLFYLTAAREGGVKNTIDASEEVEKLDDDDPEEDDDEDDDDDDDDDDIDDLSDLKNALQSDDEGTENEG
jgi:hypothetical protein